MPARVNLTKGKGRSDYLKKGSNNVICDRTGFKMKVEECSKEWNGFLVRNESWEARQPQDLLRGFPDKQSPAVSRPGTGDVFLAPGQVKASDL